MILTADEVSRSLSGTVALMNRRIEGLKAFDMSEAGFWRSFGAIWLTLPAFVVTLALERHRLGLLQPGAPIFDMSWLTLVVGFGHVASFLALPVAMIWIAPRLGLRDRYVPFVIVTNWIVVVALAILSVPAILHIVGWAPRPLSQVFAFAFGIIVLHIYWFAAKATLGVSNGLAAAIVCLGIALNVLIAGTVDALAG